MNHQCHVCAVLDAMGVKDEQKRGFMHTLYQIDEAMNSVLAHMEATGVPVTGDELEEFLDQVDAVNEAAGQTLN